eukprot:14402289-Alexandrium_andersonii.AAC.1
MAMAPPPKGRGGGHSFRGSRCQASCSFPLSWWFRVFVRAYRSFDLVLGVLGKCVGMFVFALRCCAAQRRKVALPE